MEIIQNIDLEKILTIKEYSVLKSIPLRTIYDRVKKGKLRIIKIKGLICIDMR